MGFRVPVFRCLTAFAGWHEGPQTFWGTFGDRVQARALTPFGLLRRSGCANLDFCAVVRPERECVRSRTTGQKKDARDGFRWEGLA
jgi:hypothetical protein